MTEMAMCMISSMRRKAAGLHALRGVKLRLHTNEQVKGPGGKNVKVG